MLLLALALAGCQATALSIPPTPETQALRLRTTRASAPLVRELADEYQRTHPQLRLMVELTITSRETLLHELQHPAADGPPLGIIHDLGLGDVPAARLWSAPLAQDALALIVAPGNPVRSLTLDQVEAIYQGRVASWAALGGRGVPVQAISREPEADARLLFDGRVLEDRPLSGAVMVALSDEAVRAAVEADPGAIGYVPLGWIGSTVQILALDGVAPSPADDAYPLHTTILAVGPQPASGLYRVFLAWAQSAEGQAVVARHYAPLPVAQP